jgi:hypothetical protein
MLPLVASIRTRQRRDGTVYTSVLYTLAGKQTSSSFNDHAEALRFQDVCNRLGPAEALKIWKTATPGQGQPYRQELRQRAPGLAVGCREENPSRVQALPDP